MELYNGMNDYQQDAQRTSNSEGPEAKCVEGIRNAYKKCILLDAAAGAAKGERR